MVLHIIYATYNKYSSNDDFTNMFKENVFKENVNDI